MLPQEVIEPPNTKMAIAMVFTSEKDGSWKYVIDYRRLNAMRIRYSYPVQACSSVPIPLKNPAFSQYYRSIRDISRLGLMSATDRKNFS